MPDSNADQKLGEIRDLLTVRLAQIEEGFNKKLLRQEAADKKAINHFMVGTTVIGVMVGVASLIVGLLTTWTYSEVKDARSAVLSYGDRLTKLETIVETGFKQQASSISGVRLAVGNLIAGIGNAPQQMNRAARAVEQNSSELSRTIEELKNTVAQIANVKPTIMTMDQFEDTKSRLNLVVSRLSELSKAVGIGKAPDQPEGSVVAVATDNTALLRQIQIAVDQIRETLRQK